MTENNKQRRKRLDHERYMRNREARLQKQHEYYIANVKPYKDAEKARREKQTQQIIRFAKGLTNNKYD